MTGNFTVYRSSAGSGKTFTLVKEYLVLCLSDDDPKAFRKILAITFTNKAAAEMRERIISALEHLVKPIWEKDVQVLGEALMQRCSLGKEAVQTRSRAILLAMLHNYGDLQVSTIDGFVHRIIRAFSFEFSLRHGFEVELDVNSVYREAVERLLAKAGSDSVLTDLLCDWIFQRADQEKNINVAEDLFDVVKLWAQEKHRGYLDDWAAAPMGTFDRLRTLVLSTVEQNQVPLRQAAEAILLLINQYGVTSANTANGTELENHLRQFLDTSDPRVAAKDMHDRKWLENWEPTKIWGRSSLSGPEKSALEAFSMKASPHFQILKDALFNPHSEYLYALHFLPSLYALGIALNVNQTIREICRERNVMLISEFNQKIASVVRGEPMPFVYERLGSRVSHLMIDEFQDTSIVQWSNFLPLVQDVLSNGNQVLLVGDGKQSIYRFRDGDWRQFIELPKLLSDADTRLTEERERLLRSHFKLENLNTNYRSMRRVVQFNNTLFEAFSNAVGATIPDAVALYADVKQEEKKNEDGFVAIHVEKETSKKDDAYNQIVSLLHDGIERCLSKGFRYGDIAILVWKNDEEKFLAEQFADKGYPVMAQGGLTLGASVHVRLLVDALCFLHNPLILDYRYGLWTSMKPAQIPQIPLAVIMQASPNDVLKLLGHSALYEVFQTQGSWAFCRALIKALPGFFRGDAYEHRFLDALWDWEHAKGPLASDFGAWWSGAGSSLAVQPPEEAQGIRLMTIHKSKGLQFPVVFVPFFFASQPRGGLFDWMSAPTSWEMPPVLFQHGHALEVNEPLLLEEEEKKAHLLDQLNALYVAATRAESAFFLIHIPMVQITNKKSGLYESIQKVLSEPYWSEEGPWNVTGTLLKPSTDMDKNGSEEDGEFEKDGALIEMGRGLEGVLPSKIFSEADEQQRGKALHRAFENLHSSITRAELERMLGAVVGLSTEEASKWCDTLLNMVQDPLLEPFFSRDGLVRNESWIHEEGGAFFRVDRLVQSNGEFHLLDYKTGKEDEKHKEQISRYRSILNASGMPVVRANLIYLTAEKYNVVGV
jgi:ATP-dependent exoDNAse (exonuclease V) beta subunit